MTGALIAKIMFGSLATAGSVWLGVAVIKNPKLIQEFFAHNIDVFVKIDDPAVTDENAPAEEINETTKNFECKITEKFDCTISKIDDSDIKKHFSFNTFTESTKKDKLWTEHDIYKITMLSHQFNWYTQKDKKIDILSTKTGETNKKYASTTTLFVIDRNTKIGKTQQFLAKAKDGTDSTANITSYQCSWKEDGSDPKKTCTVHEFASSETSPEDQKDHKDLTFNSGSSQATKITKHRHYIIKFTASDDKYDFTTNTPLSIIATPEPSTQQEPKTIKFINIKPTITVNDKLLIIE